MGWCAVICGAADQIEPETRSQAEVVGLIP